MMKYVCFIRGKILIVMHTECSRSWSLCIGQRKWEVSFKTAAKLSKLKGVLGT